MKEYEYGALMTLYLQGILKRRAKSVPVPLCPPQIPHRLAQVHGIRIVYFANLYVSLDRLCGLVVRVSGYRYRGPGFDPRRYQIF